MSQIQVVHPPTEQQKVEQILVYARSFRRHPLILSGRAQVSPYDLVSNGFVNKNFKEQEKQENIDDSQLRQIVCICRVPECSKTLKFNDKVEGQENNDEIQNILTQHEENCSYYEKQFAKLSINQLFQAADIFFDKIYQTYTKDETKKIQGLKMSWTLFESLFCLPSERKQSFNMLIQCYKKLDHKFNLSTKRFDKSKLLSLFGWKLSSIKQNELIVLKCHFCGKKMQKQIDSKEIDFYTEHNLWCLIRSKQYEIWKLMLKKKFMTQEKQQVEKQVEIKIKEIIVPKRMSQIESKQIREELFEVVKPVLQKIDSLLQSSIETVRKQRHLNENLKKSHKKQNSALEKQDVLLQPLIALDQISTNAKQIIKNFINSIQTKFT